MGETIKFGTKGDTVINAKTQQLVRDSESIVVRQRSSAGCSQNEDNLVEVADHAADPSEPVADVHGETVFRK